MKVKTLILNLTIATLVLPAFSQSREADILSSLIGSGTTNSSNPLDIITSSSPSSGSALEIIASATSPSGSPLDFIAESSTDSPFDYIRESSESTLNMATASLTSDAGLGALSALTSAFSGTGFYSEGTSLLSPVPTVPTRQTFAKATGTGQFIAGVGRISSGFGYRMWDKKMHNGVDIAMPVGNTVRTVRPGVITRISNEPGGYGNYVVVRHSDGLETRYAHLSRALVTIGQSVGANEPIALSGNTGRSTGPHLHFEARLNGKPVDPMTILNTQNQQNETPLLSGTNDGFTASSFGSSKKNSDSGRRTYVVKAGETIEKIAERNGITVARLNQLNFLPENQAPTPGTMLIVK